MREDCEKLLACMIVDVLIFTVAVLLTSVLAGCTAQKLAEGVAGKSLSGSGTVADQRVGIDAETKTPVLRSTVVTGDYASAKNGDYAFQYRRKKSPSIFNKDSVTEEVVINYIGTRKLAGQSIDLAKKDLAEAAAKVKKGDPKK